MAPQNLVVSALIRTKLLSTLALQALQVERWCVVFAIWVMSGPLTMVSQLIGKGTVGVVIIFVYLRWGSDINTVRTRQRYLSVYTKYRVYKSAIEEHERFAQDFFTI